MAYTLIPEGFTLKQVTKAEKDAVDEYFGRERRGTFFESFLGNPNTPTLIGGTAFIAITGVLFDFFLKSLGTTRNITFTDEEEALIRKEFERLVMETSPITTGLKSLQELFGGGKFEELFKR